MKGRLGVGVFSLFLKKSGRAGGDVVGGDDLVNVLVLVIGTSTGAGERKKRGERKN